MSPTDKLGSTAGKRARTKAANRQAILDAARKMFARIGYEATNIRDIIRETELASGTFYNYFKSKEEVFEALTANSIARFRPLLQSVKDLAPDLETYVRSAYHAYFNFLASENDLAIHEGAPHTALIGVRVDTPEMKAISEEIRMDLEVALRREGYAHIDTDYLTAAVIGVALEVGDHMLRRRPLDPDGATQFAAQIVLAGINALGEPRTA